MDWISVKEAAALYGLNAEYFREHYCGDGGEMDRRGGLRVRQGVKGRRRIQVAREVILAMIEEERRRPA